MNRMRKLWILGMMAGGLLLNWTFVSQGQTPMQFASYHSQRPQLPVQFEYPAGWQVEESSGKEETYWQLQIYGPSSLESRLRTYLVIRAVPPKASGGRYADVQEMTASYRTTLQPGLRIDQEQQRTLLGEPAVQLALSGALSLPWWSGDPQEVDVKGQRLFFAKRGWLYELGWLATPESSAHVVEAFTHLLHTLTINE